MKTVWCQTRFGTSRREPLGGKRLRLLTPHGGFLSCFGHIPFPRSLKLMENTRQGVGRHPAAALLRCHSHFDASQSKEGTKRKGPAVTRRAPLPFKLVSS